MPAAEVAAFLLERTRRAKGNRWDQGARGERLAVEPLPAPVAVFAERRVCGVPDDVARGLVAWATTGRPADVLPGIPSAHDLLLAQADGRRFVSLLSDEAAAAFGDPLHPDGLSFAIHDLCHLEKFVDPEHHVGQRGFFRACARMFADPRWQALEGRLDPQWHADRDCVVADMNGSAIFLFAALKMKLNMAARRLHAAQARTVPPDKGPLTPAERATFAPMLALMLEAMGVPPALRPAGHHVSARRDAPTEAARLLAHFEAEGLRVTPAFRT